MNIQQKGIVYSRVSTEEQLKSGVSLDYQQAACMRFAKENNIVVSSEHIFLETYSGAFFDRPQLNIILKLIQKQDIDCIIILRRDRIARDVYVYNKILNILETQGIKIYYAEETLTGEESIDEFMGNTLIGFAQYEKNMIYKRTYAGKRQKCLQGKWIFHTPYGYQKNKESELEIYEYEADIIKKIVNHYVQDNMSIGSIARLLTDEGILPPSMSKKKNTCQTSRDSLRKNSVMFWSYSAVQRILTNINKYYIGQYRAFSTKYKQIGKTSIVVGEREEKDIITIKIPQIISNELAKVVAEKKGKNKKHAKKWSHRKYMLRGKLFCDCGGEDLHNFVGYYNNSKNLRNYRCSMMNRGKASTDRWCNNSISGLKIEGLVIDTIKDFFLDYDKFLVEYMLHNNRENEVSKIEEYRYKIHKLEAKKKRALNFALDGIINESELREISNDVESNIEKCNQKMGDEYNLIYNEYKKSLLQGDVRDYNKDLYEFALEYFQKASYEDLIKIVDIMIDKVIVPKDKSNPIRIILNVFPGIFDIEEYINNFGESKEFTKEYDNQKTQLGKYQIEFSDNLSKERVSEGGDYLFIKLLKEKFHQLFINGRRCGTRTRNPTVPNRVRYQLRQSP